LAQIHHWHRHDWNSAKRHVEAALKLWPEERQDRELVSILLRAAHSAGNDGDHERARCFMHRARELANHLGQNEPLVWVQLDAFLLQLAQGMPAHAAMAICTQLETLARQGNDLSVLAAILDTQSYVLCSQGALREGLAMCAMARDIADQAGAPVLLGSCLVDQRTLLTSMGQWQEARTLSRSTDTLGYETAAWQREEAWLQGDYDGALAIVRGHLAALRAGDDTQGLLLDLWWLSDALLQLERWDEAMTTAREAATLLRSRVYWGAAGLVLAVLTEASARLQAPDGWTTLHGAEDSIVRLEQLCAQPPLLRARGLLLAQQNDLDDAIAALLNSAAVARQQGALVHVGRTLAILADIACKTGDVTLATKADAERRAIVEQIGPEVRGLPWAHISGRDPRA
jgi:tetratricopeptide (TPR) repeat protein